MKTKKTRWDKRGAYTFQFNDGTSVTLRPGEDGVTEADIKVLHSLDDAEVYNNIKNSRPPMTEAEKAAKKQWEAEHPGERYGSRRFQRRLRRTIRLIQFLSLRVFDHEAVATSLNADPDGVHTV